jgi:hypothetical protein
MDEQVIEQKENDMAAIDEVDGAKISEIFDIIENGRYTPGTVDRVIIDRPGVVGGTHMRLHDAISTGGNVVVLKNYAKEYRKIMEMYYGEGKKDRVGIVYTKN